MNYCHTIFMAGKHRTGKMKYLFQNKLDSNIAFKSVFQQINKRKLSPVIFNLEVNWVLF